MGFVYEICCKVTGEKYVGSTIQSMSKRMIGHRHLFKCYESGKKVSNCSSFDIIRRNNYSVKVLETIETKDKRELHKAETKWIKELNAINKMKKAYASLEEKRETAKLHFATEEYKKKRAEWDKKYREKNKEVLCEKKKLYRENHLDEERERAKLWRQNNKDLIKEKKKKEYEKAKENGKTDIIKCECGGTFSIRSKSRHLKTAKHMNYTN